MQWFKHDTTTPQKENNVALLEEGGLEAYGFYWRVYETVAYNLGKSSSPVCQLSPKSWARLLNLMVTRCQRLMKLLAKHRLIVLEETAEIWKVEIPDIIAHRDEYSRKRARAVHRNSGQSPDKIRTKSGECPEEDKEKDKEKDVEKEHCAKERAKSPTTTPTTTTVDFVDTPQKPPVSVSASTSISPIIAADRNRLATALGKLQVSDAELLVWQDLKTAGVKLPDVEAARKRKCQNRLTSFLGEIACEERDRRLADADDGYEKPYYWQSRNDEKQVGGVQ